MTVPSVSKTGLLKLRTGDSGLVNDVHAPTSALSSRDTVGPSSLPQAAIRNLPRRPAQQLATLDKLLQSSRDQVRVDSSLYLPDS
jgi:hypothetical protein